MTDAERFTIICNVVEALWLKRLDPDYYAVKLDDLPTLTSSEARRIAAFIDDLYQSE